MVWPQRSTVVGSTLSNRYSKHTGQFWCIARSTHLWLPCTQRWVSESVSGGGCGREGVQYGWVGSKWVGV